ncbi:MAG: hypothetical protein Q4B26_07415 [Eubacteriales bacterium]|nr:hypothetical protein [Eubacteriales bacterium]
MNFLSTIGKGLLNKPGDKLEARITKTGRQVVKLSQDNGLIKRSATKYGNGTVVETLVRKGKK